MYVREPHEPVTGIPRWLGSAADIPCISNVAGQDGSISIEVHVPTRVIQWFMVACLCCFGGVGMAAFSADANEPVPIGENTKDAYDGIPAIKLTLPEMELGKAVQFIASLSKTKIEVDPNFVHTKVTCDFNGEAFADVMANLARQVRGEVFWKDGKPRKFYIKPQPLNSSKQK